MPPVMLPPVMLPAVLPIMALKVLWRKLMMATMPSSETRSIGPITRTWSDIILWTTIRVRTILCIKPEQHRTTVHHHGCLKRGDQACTTPMSRPGCRKSSPSGTPPPSEHLNHSTIMTW
ncbi:hypothetical protein B0O80DRAFT_465254 [Mortierella sp. GBAus27b]|nr:hypothetical protein B0O80DRAFT_465254 [Mortierella sp. GBAus27b]